MELLWSHSVKIQISNNTQNITLKNPRIYLGCGHCPHFFMPELSPGSSGICHFSGGFPVWGVAGILVYEAESFTLAIHFSNLISFKKLSTEMRLELSPGKAHLGSLEDTYTHMASSTYSSSRPDIKVDCGIVGENHGTVQLSDGLVKVTATMSNARNSFLEVVLEEEEGLGKEVGIQSCDLEIMEELLFLESQLWKT